MANTITDAQIASCIHALLSRRLHTSSICPSDAARALHTDESAWRALMPEVRRVAYAMAARGEIEVTQGGKVLALDGAARGAIRLRKSGVENVKTVKNEPRPDPTPPTSNS